MASCNHVVETRTVEKITNLLYPHKGDKYALCNPRGRKWKHQPRHGRVGGPRAGVARGAPAGAPLPSEENLVNTPFKPKLFWTLPYHLSWPPLAATLGQLVNPVWDWWRWRPCQESRLLLERVRCNCSYVQLSHSPAPLLSTVLSCCTIPTPGTLVIHTRWPQIENCLSLFSLEMCRKALSSLAYHPIAIYRRLEAKTQQVVFSSKVLHMSYMTNKQFPKSGSFRLPLLQYHNRFPLYCHIFG